MSRFSITLGDYEEKIISEYKEMRNGIKNNQAVIELVRRGLIRQNENNEDEMLRNAIKEQIDFSMKPFVESIASLSSKATLMSGRSVFLLVEVMLSGLGNTKELRLKIKQIKDEASSLATSNTYKKRK